MRVSGINLPKEKRIEIALGYLYGIGLTTAHTILKATGIDPNTKVKDLKQEDEDKLRVLIEKQYKTEGDLRREVSANIKRMKDIKCYRGIRHMKHLPVHGQRTKTNSRTVRGNKRNIAPSGKKAAAQKT
jgi:small subunit ribosomal protein S13